MDRIHSILEKVGQFFSGDQTIVVNLSKSALALVCAILTGLLLSRIISMMDKRVKDTSRLQAKPQYIRFARRMIFYGLILATGSYIINLFNISLFQNIFYAFLIVLLATPVKEILLFVLKYLENNLVEKTDTKADDIIFDILNKFAGAIVYAVAIVLALDILGVNIMPFVAGAGVAGIAIGFAAKDTLSNLIAGILLLIDRPFEVGDRIELWSAPEGSATWGDVLAIGLRATKIKTTDNIVIIIPNNEINKRDIVNYTIINTKIRVRINIGIAYDADIQKAKDLIIQAALSADWVSKDPPPKVVVVNFGESSVDLQARVWIEDARQRINTISYVTDKVKGAFDNAGIEIPYPKRDITIISKD